MTELNIDDDLRIVPPATIAMIGQALYNSKEWKRPLARDVGVNEKTIRRWAKDGAPWDMAPHLAKMLRAQEQHIQALLSSLEI